MLRRFLLRLIANAVALAVAAAILPGISTRSDDIGTLLVVALIFGVLNAVLKPVFVILSCPLIILTLGLFAVVINGVLLLITDALSGGRFTVDGFWGAVLGGLVVSAVGGLVEGVLMPDKDEDRHKRNEKD